MTPLSPFNKSLICTRRGTFFAIAQFALSRPLLRASAAASAYLCSTFSRCVPIRRTIRGYIRLSHLYKYWYSQSTQTHIISPRAHYRRIILRIMQFLSLCLLTILATATHLVGAYNPIGQPCNPPGTSKREYEVHISADLVANRGLRVLARRRREWRKCIHLRVWACRHLCVHKRMRVSYVL